MPRIVCLRESGSELFHLSEAAVIGRSSAADFVVNDSTVSRRHARFFPEAGRWFVEDLGSGNGTAVNGVLVRTPTPLEDGDEILLGKLEARFEEPVPMHTTSEVLFHVDQRGEHLSVLDATPLPYSEAVLDATARLQMVADAASAIARAVNEEQLFSMVTDRLFAIFAQADRACVITVDESGALQPRLGMTRSGKAGQIPVSRTLLDDVINKRHGVVSADAASDERFATSTVAQLSLRTVVCAPMVAGDLVLGALQIDSADGTRPFVQDDLATLLAIAAVTGVALANQRINRELAVQQMLAQDLALAKRIQRHFFPEAPPAVAGYAFDSHYSPALGVGGDYFDFIRLSDSHYAVIIADVSGKGISAALYMAKLSSEVRYHTSGRTDAADIVRRVNKAIGKDLADGMFITMLLIVLNTKTGEMDMAAAGHMGPVVRRASGDTMQVRIPQNEPLGMPNYGGLEAARFQLQPGDVVVLFTDGVSEGMNPRKELFGEKRIHEAVAGTRETSPAGVKKAILDNLETFCDGADQNDDITLISFGPLAR